CGCPSNSVISRPELEGERVHGGNEGNGQRRRPLLPFHQRRLVNLSAEGNSGANPPLQSTTLRCPSRLSSVTSSLPISRITEKFASRCSRRRRSPSARPLISKRRSHHRIFMTYSPRRPCLAPTM